MAIGITSTSYTSIFGGTNWIADSMKMIQEAQTSGGMLGALEDAGGDPFVTAANVANALATISQTRVTDYSKLVSQMAAKVLSERSNKKAEQMLKELEAAKTMVQPKNVLDSIIYFEDGSTIDTVANIMTNPKGEQFDTLTGAPYNDPAAIIQLANGAYINTMTNIMTMPDGTRIDMVTGLVISTSA